MAQTSSTIKLIFEGVEHGIGAAAARAGAAVRGLTQDQDKLTKSTKDVQSSVGNLVSSFVGKTGLLTIGAGAAGIGAVGTAAAAAAPLLLGMGAAFATTKLGADGFKKASEQLKKPVDDLKASLSGTFAKELTPAFAKLGPVITSLQGPLTGMAKAEAGVVRGLIDTVVNARKMGQLNAIIQGGTDLITGMSGGLDKLVAGMLSVGSAGARSMRGLGDAVGSVLGKLGDTLQGLAADGTIAKGIDSLSATVRGLGDAAAPVIDVVLRMGAAIGGSLGNVLSSFGEAIKRAGPGLVALAGAGGRLLDTLAPLLPTIGEVAGALGTAFAGSIDALLPTIKGLVGFLNEHKDQLVALIPLISTAATMYAEFKVLSLVGGWVKTATTALGLFATEAAVAGTAAEVAGAKTATLGTKLRGISGLAAAVALGAAAVAMDQVNAASEQGNLAGWNGELHDIARILSGDWGNPVADINAQLDQMNQKWSAGQAPVQQWALSVGTAATDAATSMQNFFRGLVGLPPLPPLKLHVDTQPATNEFLGWQHAASDGVAVAQLDADPAKANAARAGWGTATMATTATAHLNAEAAGANSTVAGWKGSASATTGQAHLDAEAGRATGSVQAWKGTADRTWGTVHANADTRQAMADLARLTQTRYMTIEAIVRTRALPPGHSAAGGGVTGGKVAQHFDLGGGVAGPGSGTSDSVPAMLSNGEWVMTADQVRAAGGFAGMQRLAGTLAGGGMRASAQAAMRSVPAPSSGSGGGVVTLKVAPGGDGALATLIMRMVREGQIQLKAA